MTSKTKQNEAIAATHYDAGNIQVLKGLEAVRRRPGMYVGGTDVKAFHHLTNEIVDNSIDEALAGRCDRIEVVIHPDSSVSVSDNGYGIPVAEHPTEKVSALQVVHTSLHSGGKFDNAAYKVSGGLHGVGAAAVNALSEWMEVTVRRDGAVWRQRYERGVPMTPVVRLRDLKKGEETGTTTTFNVLLAESVIRPGENTVQVLIPAGEGDATTYAVAEHLDEATYALRGDRLVPAGGGEAVAVARPDDDRRLEVESAFQDGQTLAVKGWAADVAATRLPDAVLLFVDGEQVGSASRRERPDLVATLGSALTQAGFEKVVAADRAPDGARVEVVALFGDQAVRARVRPDR